MAVAEAGGMEVGAAAAEAEATAGAAEGGAKGVEGVEGGGEESAEGGEGRQGGEANGVLVDVETAPAEVTKGVFQVDGECVSPGGLWWVPNSGRSE